MEDPMMHSDRDASPGGLRRGPTRVTPLLLGVRPARRTPARTATSSERRNHPLGAEEILRLLRTATQEKLHFGVNGDFPHLVVEHREDYLSERDIRSMLSHGATALDVLSSLLDRSIAELAAAAHRRRIDACDALQHNLRELTNDPRYWRFMALDASAQRLEEDRDLMYVKAEHVQRQEAAYFSQRSSDEQHLRVCMDRAEHVRTALRGVSFTLTGVAHRTPLASDFQIQALWSAQMPRSDGAAPPLVPPVEISRLRGLIARTQLGRFVVRSRPRDDQAFRALRVGGLIS